MKDQTVREPAALDGTAAVELRDRPIMYRLADAARLTGLSPDFLRRCDCPKVIIRGTGAKDRRPIIGIMADDLLGWLRQYRESA